MFFNCPKVISPPYPSPSVIRKWSRSVYILFLSLCADVWTHSMILIFDNLTMIALFCCNSCYIFWSCWHVWCYENILIEDMGATVPSEFKSCQLLFSFLIMTYCPVKNLNRLNNLRSPFLLSLKINLISLTRYILHRLLSNACAKCIR